MRRFLAALGVAVMLAVVPQAWGEVASGATVERIDFAVTRGGDPMGWHRLRIVHDGLRTTVEVMADFEIGFGPFTLFRYTHRNRTVLEAGRIVRVQTRTNDDGTFYAVNARREGGRLILAGLDGRIEVPADIFPSDYWRPATIDQDLLLDTQKGILRQVAIAPAPAGEGCWNMTGDLAMRLCYDPAQGWVGGSFDGRGRQVVYTRRELAADAPWSFSLDDVPPGTAASRHIAVTEEDLRR